jgi:hypothetical protein
MIRGVTNKDTCFYDMVMAGVSGAEYRYDVKIYHYHRSESDAALKGEPSKRYVECYNCFATRAKGMADMDSTGGDVSLTELDLAVESFEIKYDE